MGNILHTQRADNSTYYSFFKQRALDFGSDPLFHFKATEYNEDAVANGPYLRLEGRQGTSFSFVKDIPFTQIEKGAKRVSSSRPTKTNISK